MGLKGARELFYKDIWTMRGGDVYKNIMKLIIAAGGIFFNERLLTLGIHVESQPQELCNSLLRRLSHDIPVSVITDEAASRVINCFHQCLPVALSTCVLCAQTH